MNLTSSLLWGFVATIVLATIMAGGLGLHLSRMSIPFMLGTMLTPDRERAQLIGFTAHFLNGWIFAFVYAFAFESLGRATWWMGAIAGLIHGLFVLVAGMSVLPAMHPRMASENQGPTPTRQLQPPGFLALNYGRATPLVALVAHIAYGTILGAFYRLAGS